MTARVFISDGCVAAIVIKRKLETGSWSDFDPFSLGSDELRVESKMKKRCRHNPNLRAYITNRFTIRFSKPPLHDGLASLLVSSFPSPAFRMKLAC